MKIKCCYLTILLLSFPLFAGNRTAKPGDNLETLVAQLHAGDTLFVANGEYNSSFSAENSGTAKKPIVIMAASSQKPIIYSSDDKLFNLSEDYTIIDGFIFDHKGKANDAIRIRGNFNQIRNCEIRNGKRDAIELNSGTGTIIMNNYIHNFVWQPGKDAHGIVTDPGVENLQIINNVIENVGGDCIQLYASGSTPISEYSKNITIVDNTFSTTLGSNSENALDFKGVDGATIIGNEMFGFDNKAVVVQKGSRNLLFESNIIHDSERGMEFRGEDGKSQENITIRNNIIYNIKDYYAVKFDWVDNVKFTNNTMAFINANAVLIEEEGLTNAVIKNNIIFQAEEPKISGDFSAEFGNNGWFSTDPGELQGPGDITGNDPKFMNAQQFDFTLSSQSPAIDAGANLGANFAGLAPDLGALEYGDMTSFVNDDPTINHLPGDDFKLSQNWPNPFNLARNAETRIAVDLKKATSFDIAIYNVLGQQVATLYSGVIQHGNRQFKWNGRNAWNQIMPAGVYFIQAKTAGAQQVKSFIFLH